MNSSDLMCEQTQAIAGLLREAADLIEAHQTDLLEALRDFVRCATAQATSDED